eukprot:6202180-Amphidinium_carterae.1
MKKIYMLHKASKDLWKARQSSTACWHTEQTTQPKSWQTQVLVNNQNQIVYGAILKFHFYDRNTRRLPTCLERCTP